MEIKIIQSFKKFKKEGRRGNDKRNCLKYFILSRWMKNPLAGIWPIKTLVILSDGSNGKAFELAKKALEITCFYSAVSDKLIKWEAEKHGDQVICFPDNSKLKTTRDCFAMALLFIAETGRWFFRADVKESLSETRTTKSFGNAPWRIETNHKGRRKFQWMANSWWKTWKYQNQIFAVYLRKVPHVRKRNYFYSVVAQKFVPCWTIKNNR